MNSLVNTSSDVGFWHSASFARTPSEREMKLCGMLHMYMQHDIADTCYKCFMNCVHCRWWIHATNVS
nr:unnamed protein product [Callosobruchus analis]